MQAIQLSVTDSEIAVLSVRPVTAGTVGLPAGMSCRRTFAATPYLVSIDQVIVGAGAGLSDAFVSATALEHAIFFGIISLTGLDVKDCRKLSVESLLSILNCLKDYSQDERGLTWKVTLGATNIGKLTEEQLAIAEQKGWTVA